MAIKGFICPDTESPVDFETCLKCAYTFENPCQYTYPLIKGMIENIGRPPGISTSTIAGCPREMALIIKNDVYVQPPYWAFRGTLVHGLIEKYYRENTMVEHTLKMEWETGVIDGPSLVTSTPDLIIPDEQIKIIEFKTAKGVPKYNNPYKGHTVQLNIQRYLLWKDMDLKAAHLEVQYMDMGVAKRLIAKPWDMEEIEDYMAPRIVVLQRVISEGYMPPVLDTRDLMYFKCNGYCDVADLCRQEEIKEIREESGIG